MKTLERRLSDTLRHETEMLPDEEAAHTLIPVEQMRSGFLRPGLAAPAAVVAVMIIAAPVIWLSAQRGGGDLTPVSTPTTQAATIEPSQPVATTTPDTTPALEGQLGTILDQIPDGFDLEQAIPVFTVDAGVEETALRYLETRHLPDNVGISRVEEQDVYTMVRWAWGRLLDETEIEQGESGWLVMRAAGIGYEVLAATTDGIDLSDVIQTSTGHIIGGVISNSDQHIGVDVLNLDETPVDSAPNPEGMPDADYLWGTAASGKKTYDYDDQLSCPVFLRVNRVGGTLLSISEVVLGDGLKGEVADDVEAPVEEIPEPAADNWTDLPGGLSVALVEEANGRSRIWTKSAVQEPTAAASTDMAFIPVPVNATQIAVVIPAWQFYAEQGIDVPATERSEVVNIHWFEGSDAVDTVNVDWTGDERFGVALVEARDATILDFEYVTTP